MHRLNKYNQSKIFNYFSYTLAKQLLISIICCGMLGLAFQLLDLGFNHADKHLLLSVFEVSAAFAFFAISYFGFLYAPGFVTLKLLVDEQLYYIIIICSSFILLAMLNS